MIALAFIQLNRTTPSRTFQLPVPDPPTTDSDEQRLLSILNWIALFFVRDSKDDCVASALFVEDHKITLYLATNRGRPQEVDIQNGNKLISTLRQAYHDPQKAQELLFNSAISITYRRFYRKVDMIKDIRLHSHNDSPTPPAVPPIEMFENLVTKWAKAKGLEEKQGLIDFVRLDLNRPTDESGGGEAANALKALFRYFFERISLPQVLASDKLDLRRILSDAWSYCYLAILLLNSNFFSRAVLTDVQGKSPFNAEEYSWLRILRRRLWHISRYWIDAGSMAATGIKWIRNALGNNELTEGADCFTVVWVGLDADTLPRNHGRKYPLKDRPVDHFKRLLGNFKFEETSEIKQQRFTTNLEGLWPNSDEANPPTFTPFLHCELQIVSYLERHNFKAHMSLIGVSKSMCWACNTYVKEVN
jgi:hypothetical protein